MADVSVTAGNVAASSTARIRRGTAGATITAGQVVYEDPADSYKFKLADANASATTANVAGIALHAALAGHPLAIVEEDESFTPGFTVDLTNVGAKGVYVLSATAGGICPIADLVAGCFPVLLMTGKTASTVKLIINRGAAATT